MKHQLLNIYNLHKKILFWEKYEKNKLIYKYLLKNLNISKKNKLLLKLKIWNKTSIQSISNQTNICRTSGRIKKVFNLIGLNRHAIRQNLNVGLLPVLKKLHW